MGVVQWGRGAERGKVGRKGGGGKKKGGGVKKRESWKGSYGGWGGAEGVLRGPMGGGGDSERVLGGAGRFYGGWWGF